MADGASGMGRMGTARRHGEKARRREQGERQNEKCGSRDHLAGEEKTTVTGGGNQGRLYRQSHKREENGGVKGGLQGTAGRNKAAS